MQTQHQSINILIQRLRDVRRKTSAIHRSIERITERVDHIERKTKHFLKQKPNIVSHPRIGVLFDRIRSLLSLQRRSALKK